MSRFGKKVNRCFIFCYLLKKRTICYIFLEQGGLMLLENSSQNNQSSEEVSETRTSRRSSETSFICGIGTAFPAQSYTQNEVSDLLGIDNPTVRKLLSAPHILTRQLYLPKAQPGGKSIATETHEDLNQKFDGGILDIGLRAATQALADCPFAKDEIQFLICVTSSGFRVPGVSSMIARALGLPANLYRLDVVGMGCNAGMSLCARPMRLPVAE